MDAQIKQEVADTTKKVITVFTVQYSKAYVLALVRLIKEESQKEPDPWQLEERPPWTDDYKSGQLVKEGAVRKNWKKRWFIVRPNYTVDYYENEVESQKPKGKKKGTMNLCGYSVVEDPNQGILVRLKRLAEKMGVDFSNLPKPKEYPPLVFELYHPRRRCYYIQAANKQEFDDWVAEFKKVCWRAYGLTIDERCHKEAFPVAVRKTRWELGRWGWYSGYGSEEQILADMISDELEWDIMGRIYAKLSGPWMVRNLLRNQVQKTIDTMVMTAVKPAWAGMAKAVSELRPKIEPKIRQSVEPIFAAENAVIDKMKAAVISVIDPLLIEHVSPHLSKIMAILKSPMSEAFAEAASLLNAKIDKWKPDSDLKRSFRELDYFPQSYWEMRPATDKTDVMYEPLWALHLIFQDIYPWSLIWKAHDCLRTHTDKAVYTWEKEVVDAEKGAPAKAKIEVMDKFEHDAQIATTQYFSSIMKTIVMPPFEALLHPACKAAIEPLADAIPEPLREFLDINQMFEDLYNGIVDAAIATVVRSDDVEPHSSHHHHDKHHHQEKHQDHNGAGAEGAVPAVATSTTTRKDSGVSEDETELDKPLFITAKKSDLVLDVEGGRLEPGVQVILWNKKASDVATNQRWVFTSDKNIALAANPDLVLDVQERGEHSHVIINTKKTSDNHSQIWKLKHKRLVNKANGHVMEVKSGKEQGAELIATPHEGKKGIKLILEAF